VRNAPALRRAGATIVGVHARGRCLLAGAALFGSLLGTGAASATPAAPTTPQLAETIARAQQAFDDAVYLPVRVHGHWELSGSMRTWLQPSISLTSEPWRWAPERCAVLDPVLAPGMRVFLLTQIDRLFTGPLHDTLRSQFLAHLGRVSSPSCVNPNRSATGPPGPLIDHTSIDRVTRRGSEIVVHAQVAVDDWQSGVSHLATPGNGRRIGWRLVRGLLDAQYTLRAVGASWKVVAISSNFAPGHQP